MEEMLREVLARLAKIEGALASPAKEYVDAEACAEFTSVSTAQLAEWRSRGGGPRFIKLGRKVLYKVSDLRDFLDASAHGGLS